MPKNFFVVGHARSRTAWLSVFLTSTYSYCYHEALRYAKDGGIDAYKALLARDDYLYVGDSDNGLINIDIGRFYPDAPVVMIERDIHDICDSLINLFGSEPGHTLDMVSENRKRIHDAVRHCNNVMIVDYNDINDKLEYIWMHCVGKGFDKNRAEHLIGMNIQTQHLRQGKLAG